jgi:hypothetical protein
MTALYADVVIRDAGGLVRFRIGEPEIAWQTALLYKSRRDILRLVMCFLE